MMVKKVKEEQVIYQPGDKVMWNGIPLTIYRIDEKQGLIYAQSLHMQLVVDSHDQLVKAE
jgi:hypothetical protein